MGMSGPVRNPSSSSTTPSPASPYSHPIVRSTSQEDSKGLQNILLRNKLAAGLQQQQLTDEAKYQELSIEFEQLKSHAGHVESQNQVLELSLEDSKSLNEQLSVVLSKRESNESVLTLSLHYCDAIIEAYDVLVALLETENSMLQCADLSPRGSEESGSFGSSKSRRARSQRRSAEKVARHLLNRLDRTLVSNDVRNDSNVQMDVGLSSPTGCWEDSSGYSHTTRFVKCHLKPLVNLAAIVNARSNSKALRHIQAVLEFSHI